MKREILLLIFFALLFSITFSQSFNICDVNFPINITIFNKTYLAERIDKGIYRINTENGTIIFRISCFEKEIFRVEPSHLSINLSTYNQSSFYIVAIPLENLGTIRFKCLNCEGFIEPLEGEFSGIRTLYFNITNRAFLSGENEFYIAFFNNMFYYLYKFKIIEEEKGEILIECRNQTIPIGVNVFIICDIQNLKNAYKIIKIFDKEYIIPPFQNISVVYIFDESYEQKTNITKQIPITIDNNITTKEINIQIEDTTKPIIIYEKSDIFYEHSKNNYEVYYFSKTPLTEAKIIVNDKVFDGIISEEKVRFLINLDAGTYNGILRLCAGQCLEKNLVIEIKKPRIKLKEVIFPLLAKNKVYDIEIGDVEGEPKITNYNVSYVQNITTEYLRILNIYVKNNKIYASILPAETTPFRIKAKINIFSDAIIEGNAIIDFAVGTQELEPIKTYTIQNINVSCFFANYSYLCQAYFPTEDVMRGFNLITNTYFEEIEKEKKELNSLRYEKFIYQTLFLILLVVLIISIFIILSLHPDTRIFLKKLFSKK